MNGSRISRELGRALLLCACVVSGFQPLRALDPHRGIGQYIVSSWTSKHSFPFGAVHAIAQSPDGYLWIGTEAGLVRFDGISFRLLDHANTPTLPAGHILGLAVDADGVLWVRLESPYLLRYRDGAFEQALPVQLESSGATAMTRDRTGHLLVAAHSELLRYRGTNVTRARPLGKSGGLAISVAETVDGTVWLGMRDTGLIRVRGGAGAQVPGLPDQKVNAMLEGSPNVLWIGTDSGLVRWDGASITRDGVPSKVTRARILALARDRDANLWVATPTGVVRVSDGGAVDLATERLGIGQVHAMFEDREGSLWLGGAHGLVRLRDSIVLRYGDLQASAVHVDKCGHAWVAPSNGGLVRIRQTERYPITEAGLQRDVVYSISGGPKELWVGRRHGGLAHLQEGGGDRLRVKTYTAKDGLATGGIYAVHRGGDGAVWAGSVHGGVSRIHNGRVSTFTTRHGLNGEAITTIAETFDGAIWVGTSGGLQAFRSGAWKLYGGSYGLPPGRVNSLTTDPDGVLWIGTSAGLFYWSGTRAEPVRQAPDLLHGEVLGLAADRRGTLWIAAQGRVFRAVRASLLGRSAAPTALREFGVSDGLPSTQALQRDRSMRIDPSGRIWLLLHGGLCALDPARPADLPPASVTVEAVRVDGQPLGDGPEARYESSRRRIAFNFIGVSLSVPERVRYRYRLDGYDADWSQPTDSREAAYTNLPPRAYKFRLMASNGDGLWNGSESNVAFVVEPQFWQTWWFHTALAALAIATAFSVYRYRVGRVRAALNLRFEERLAERTRIAQELHDTLLQGCLSASMQLQVAADLLPEDVGARPLVSRALQLLQQVVEEGRNTVRGLRLTGTRAALLETALSQIKEEFAPDDDVDFRVVVEGRRLELHPVLQDEVYRIGREALINAFRHGRAKHVEVELSYGPERFRLLVRDDGCGIDASVIENGRDGHWGLIGMRERAERLGAQLRVFSGPSAGTEIELDIPSKIAFRGSLRT